MKKFLKVSMLLMLCAAMLAGCGNGGAPKKSKDKEDVEKVEENAKDVKDFADAKDISYVLIYNPKIYDETAKRNELLNTGDFAAYVEAVINKADELPEVPEFMPYSSSENMPEGLLDNVDLSGSRGGFVAQYDVGDTHEFYCGSESRNRETFECVYAGDNCYIWIYDNSVSASELEKCGKEFDKNIYDKVVSMFGEPRYADEGGKINLLVYPFTSANLMGFFYPGDLFATGEVSPQEVARYGLNTDHAILNINSQLIGYDDLLYSTMAHEFQHLICFTDYFYTANGGINMRTWLNEAMSGYVEEQLYQGVKELSGHYDAFSTSNRIRHGQSMYNFETTLTQSNLDIGVYGSVYLFSEYLANLAGDDVFSDIHEYWRESGSRTLDEAEAIVNSVPEKVYKKIDKSIDYKDKVDFDSDDEEWLSKLTLDFYMSLLKYDKNDPKAYKKVKGQTLLYDEINPADIEGGGRVIVALKKGKFKIPKDADEGFVYVGLNDDFEVVTDYIIK